MAECLILGVGSSSTSDDVTATSDKVLAPYTAITADSDEPVEGTMPSKSAATYNTSTSDQTIKSGQYLSGNQTIKAVTTSNIDAGNIKKGVVVKVGDANSPGRIKDVTGTYTTVSSGQSALTAATLRKGYSGFANGGAEVKGNMTEKAAQTYYAITSAQTIAKDQYLTGVQTIHALSSTNLTADNIKKGVTVSVNNGNVDVYNVTGTWYGNKEAIGVSTYSGSFGYADPETQEFTMPDSGIIYYGGFSCAVNKNGRCLCRIYKNGEIVDNRDIDYDWQIRASMYNQSFSAEKNDVIKVEVNCTAGDCVAGIQAVIVY